MGVPHYLIVVGRRLNQTVRGRALGARLFAFTWKKQLDLRAKNDDIRLFFALFFLFKLKEEHVQHG